MTMHSAALATTAAYVVGSLMLVPLAVITAPWFPRPDLGSPVAWTVVLYQAILGAVAHVWWYEGVKEVGPSRAAIFMNLQPIVGLVLAWLLLGERIGVPELVGGAAVLTGVALTTHPPPAGSEVAPPAGDSPRV
jgi:drug/metabolite transporter (DMT)-like permease